MDLGHVTWTLLKALSGNWWNSRKHNSRWHDKSFQIPRRYCRGSSDANIQRIRKRGIWAFGKSTSSKISHFFKIAIWCLRWASREPRNRSFASKKYLSTLFASGQNFGLLSLGHLLEVTSATPSVCSVTGVATWDRTGGIFTRASVNTLSLGTCSVLWRFLGFKGRAATSTTMNIEVNR